MDLKHAGPIQSAGVVAVGGAGEGAGAGPSRCGARGVLWRGGACVYSWVCGACASGDETAHWAH